MSSPDKKLELVMAEAANAVKDLQEQGIESLFTNMYLESLGSLKETRERFEKEYQEEVSVRRYPLMNLLGFLSFKIGNDNDAIKMFTDILDKKPDNLLALLNLRYLYNYLGLYNNVQHYEKQLACHFRDSYPFALVARAKYELAEILTASDAYKQAGAESKIIRLFKDSLGCEGVDALEKLEWEFGFAFFYFKVDSFRGENCVDYFISSVKYFYKTLSTISPQPKTSDEQTSWMLKRMEDMVPKAWCFMSTLMSRWNRAKDYDILSKIAGLHCLVCHFKFTWRDCLREAETTCSDHNKHVVFRRIGGVLLQQKEMEEAKKYLEQALELKKEGYGYMLLGRWNLQMYTDPDVRREVYLKEALRYFKLAIEAGCDLWHCYRDYAECLFYEEDYTSALSYCEKAKKCGAKYDSSLYYLQANIYEKCNEPEKKEEMKRQGDMIKHNDFGRVHCYYC